MERYLLIYVFLCFVVGVASLGLVLNLARRREAVLARAFVAFYLALSAMVCSTLLLSVLDAFPDSLNPRARPFLEYTQSIVGFYAFMFTLPFFFHRVFGVATPRRERWLLGYVIAAAGVQHVTEYALSDVWDQRGDILENLLFLLVVFYATWIGYSQRKSPGTARPLGDRLLIFIAFGLPFVAYDLFLADATGIAFFPIGYCILSIVVTWTLAQAAAPSLKAKPDWNLSDRERDVLELLQRGLSNKDIGHELHISPNTVKTHLRSIFEKTGAQSRFQLIAMAQSPIHPKA